MPELDYSQYDALVGGGPTQLHHHPKNVDRQDVLQYQEAMRIREVIGDYTATYEDDVILADTNAGDIIVTLPLALGQKEFIVVKSGQLNNLTINFSGGATCFGIISFILTALADTKRLKAHNGNWTTL